LARDNVTPFSTFFSKASARLSCPVPATLFCGKHVFPLETEFLTTDLLAVLTTAFGAIQLGSKTAFADLSGSFIILTTTSYAMAILPHVLSGRKNVPQGPFWLGRAGFFVNTISVLLIIFTNVMFCFPYALPATVPVCAHGVDAPRDVPLIMFPADDELQLSHTRRLRRDHDILVDRTRVDPVSWAASASFRRGGPQNRG
jgi:hypothetical protein